MPSEGLSKFGIWNMSEAELKEWLNQSERKIIGHYFDHLLIVKVVFVLFLHLMAGKSQVYLMTLVNTAFQLKVEDPRPWDEYM